MSLWGKLAFQGKTFGLKDLSKKRRKKNSVISKKLRKKKKRTISKGEMIQRDFRIMLDSIFLDDSTKKFLHSLRGSYTQFKRLTPRQLSVSKKIWWQMKDKQKQNDLEDFERRVNYPLDQEYLMRMQRD
jgi:hypothetical protein